MKLRRVCLQTTTAETGKLCTHAQERRCAGAAPWSSINLLTHTGSIMSPPSFLPPSCLVRRLSSSPAISLASAFTHCLTLELFHPRVSILHQSAVSGPGLGNGSTRPCPARLSVYPSARLHPEPLPFKAYRGNLDRCNLHRVTSNRCNFLMMK